MKSIPLLIGIAILAIGVNSPIVRADDTEANIADHLPPGLPVPKLISQIMATQSALTSTNATPTNAAPAKAISELSNIKTNGFVAHVSIAREIFLDGGELIADVEFKTNVTTQWIGWKPIAGELWKTMGVLQTNRIMVIRHDGVTNEFALHLIGEADHPTEFGTNIIQGARR